MNKTLPAITALNLLMLAAVLLNIPVLREMVVFIYLSFVPGFLLLKILKSGETNRANIFLLSVGLSLAFLMFIGLLINTLSLIGISRPLSAVPLVLGISLSTAVLLIACYKRDLSNAFGSFKIDSKIATVFSLKHTILVVPPVLGAVSAFFLNVPLLLILIAFLAVIFVVSALSSKLIPSELYPILLFSVSLALLFHVVFTSQYIIGFDANLEYFVFKSTLTNGHWGFIDPLVYTAPTVSYNAMLSITVLPTIYASLMNVTGETVFKLLYPFVFSLVAVALYQIFERLIGRLASLLSVFFFMSGVLVFYGVTPISLDRQIVAEFFFVLSIFVLLNRTISIGKRRLLLILFGAALAFSHYSLMYIYLGFLLFSYAVSKFKRSKGEALNGVVVLSLIAITLSWYYLAVAPFNSLTQFVSGVYSNFFADLLNPAARSTQTFLSQPASNPINAFSVVIFLVANLFVALGILRVVFRPQKSVFDLNFRAIVTISAILLFVSFALPNFAPSLHIDRFYAISLLFLAPCFVLGFNALLDIFKLIWQKISSQHVSTEKFEQIASILLCIFLISFFFTQTGFVNRIAGNTPLLRTLDLDRLKESNNVQLEVTLYNAYLPDSDVYGATWLGEHLPTGSLVFRDIRQEYVLSSYGLIPIHLTRSLTNTSILSEGNLIYAGRLNIVDGVLNTELGTVNFSEVMPLLSQADIVYSNGGTEVLYTVPNR